MKASNKYFFKPFWVRIGIKRLSIFIFLYFIWIIYANALDNSEKGIAQNENNIRNKRIIDDISTVANIATSLGFIIALLALYRETKMNTAQKLNEQADSYRQTLESINQEIQSLHKLLRDGSPLIYGADEIAKELAERLKDKSQKLIADEQERNGLILSSSVIGWYKSPLTAQLSSITDNLRRNKVKLNGVTKIFSELIDIMDGMVDDSYSPMIFLSLLGYENLEVLDESEKENNQAFISLLSNNLHANAAKYFMIRYYKSIAEIKEFIEVATFALSNLNDSSLVQLCRLELNAPAELRTKTIKIMLEMTKNYLKKDELEILYSILGKIEVSIKKESAYQQLDKDKLTA